MGSLWHSTIRRRCNQFKFGELAKHSVKLNLQQIGSAASSSLFAKCDEIEFAACDDKK